MMSWWKASGKSRSSSSNSIQSPTSSASSASSPFSPSRTWSPKDGGSFKNGWGQNQPRKRLTRQRKLRYLTDAEAGLPSPASGSQTSTVVEMSYPDTALPSPESFGYSRADSSSTWPSNSSCWRLPSPGQSERTHHRTSASDCNYENGSSLGLATIQKRTFHVYARSYGYPLEHTKEVDVQHSTYKVHHIDTPDVIAKSAPSSGLSSPNQSPRRLSTGDRFLSSSGYGEELHAYHPRENPFLFHDLSNSLPPQGIGGTVLPVPGHSFHHSPGRKITVSISQNGLTSATSSKMSQESSPVVPEVSNVHPLPLPPPAAASRSSSSLQVVASSKSSSSSPQPPASCRPSSSSPQSSSRPSSSSPQPPASSRPSSSSPQPAATPNSSTRTAWQKKSIIGCGTYGRVYRAINSETGATCAMKEVCLAPDDPSSADSIKHLEKEIETLSQLKHHNIVQYYGSEVVEDHFYIYLEFVHPGSITKFIQESGGSLPEAVVRNFTRHILLGLAYLHSKDVVHRDIKGANLLVNDRGVVKLADFGMAKYLSGQPTPLSLKGSPYWMAPELLQKETGQHLAVDIWSLGCTIIEMITGKPPWGDLPGAAAMFNVMKSKVPPIPETLSSKGKDFLRCCLQINPEERATAMELLEHPFLENPLHQQISSYHQTVLDNTKLDIASKSRDRANRATNNKATFPRM
ncbi:mitogen-activated protein kinase kinase kinase 5-like [Nymphaea colorata]|nr:mitogen-activated protein kinase kinase kinase 5-like [Nymphaea colorata]XP_031480196.1 mitogen-activated protein kinase kinase kinase 5-like [Nymphaea colorata]